MLPNAQAEVAAHRAIQNLLRELQDELAARRVKLDLRLLARRHGPGCQAYQWPRVLRSMLQHAIASVRPGTQLTVRTTCPDESSVRVELKYTARRACRADC